MKKRVTPDDTTAAEGKTIPRLYLREVSPTDDDGPYEGIGADLRAARVETGVDIAAVADNTRISRGYLEAIEDGRFNDLPGGAYVYGFLRSYAEYLDLDPKSVIAKYKSESEHPRAETKLAFPSPMDQGRLPTGRLLASSLVLAGLVYAGWYVVSGGQQQSAEVVSPVPERFAAILDNSASSDTTGQGLPGTQSVLGVAAPVQDVEIAPVGPPEEALIAGATQTQIPAPPAPAPQVASTGEASAADSTNEPALPLRRQGEQQVAALAPEEILAAVMPEETPAAVAAVALEEAPAAAVTQDAPPPVRAEEQASTAQPVAPGTQSVTNDAPAARTTAPSEQAAEFAGLGASEAPPATPARTEDTPPTRAANETHETVPPAAVEAPAAAPPPPRKKAEEPQVAVVELPSIPPVPTVIEPVREDVQIVAASPTPREIAEEEQAAAALAASPVIEQSPLAAPEPRVVTTEPAFLAAERAQNAERQRRQLAAANERPADDQAAVAVRPPSAGPSSVAIEVADLGPAIAPETSNQVSETIQLAAARRISELTNNEAAANGAVRSFPVPPPIPGGTQTAALSRTGDYVPQVFGASNEDARVVIEARLESWVQVRGRSGETLLTRILRVGDKYLVPNRPNLVMMTGNAGALKIIVDGKEIGPLGPPGAVLRNVSLEPSQLLARAASQ